MPKKKMTSKQINRNAQQNIADYKKRAAVRKAQATPKTGTARTVSAAGQQAKEMNKIAENIKSKTSSPSTQVRSGPPKTTSKGGQMSRQSKSVAVRGNTSPAVKAPPRVEKFMGNAEVVKSPTLSSTVKTGLSTAAKVGVATGIAGTAYGLYEAHKGLKENQQRSSAKAPDTTGAKVDTSSNRKMAQDYLKNRKAGMPHANASSAAIASNAPKAPSKAASTTPAKKYTTNMKDFAIGSQARIDEYKRRGWAMDDTTKLKTPTAKPATQNKSNPKPTGGNAPIVTGMTLEKPASGGGAPVYSSNGEIKKAKGYANGGPVNAKQYGRRSSTPASGTYGRQIHQYGCGGKVGGKK